MATKEELETIGIKVPEQPSPNVPATKEQILELGFVENHKENCFVWEEEVQGTKLKVILPNQEPFVFIHMIRSAMIHEAFIKGRQAERLWLKGKNAK